MRVFALQHCEFTNKAAAFQSRSEGSGITLDLFLGAGIGLASFDLQRSGCCPLTCCLRRDGVGKKDVAVILRVSLFWHVIRCWMGGLSKDGGKKKKYLNKWHICWGEVQPLWSRLHYGDQRCSWPACALTLFLEAEALTLEVNTDGRRRSGYKTAALLRKQLGCCSQLQRSFFPQLSATCIHSLVHLGLTRSGASGNL